MTGLAQDISAFDALDNFHLTDAEEMGSLNHSYLQSKIGALFFTMTDYIALTELSLDTSTVKDVFPTLVMPLSPI